MGRLQIALFLAAITLLAFANAVNHPFVHDDIPFIQQNPYIHDLNPKSIFVQTSLASSKSPLINQYYRPLLEVVNRVLYRFIGNNPHGFHLFNVLLHIINGYLVYHLIWMVAGRNQGLSLAAAVLFLVHPVQSEAVACISGISNLVFTFLCLASLNMYLTALHGENRKIKQAWYAAALAVFFLALLAKEQSAVLPALIVAYEFCFIEGPLKKEARKYWPYCAGFFMVLGAYFLMRTWLFGFALTPVPGSQAELGLRLAAIPRTLLTFLGIIVFPRGLHYYRSQDILLPSMGPSLILLSVVLLWGGLILKTPRPQKRWMLFGSAWFIIALLPTLNIIPLVNEYSTVLTAEHFLYLPVIGIFLFFGAAVHRWAARDKDKNRLRAVFGVFAVITALCVGSTVYQNTFWRAEIPLFERTLRYEPNFGRVRFLLAKAYSGAGRYEDSLVESHKALEIMQGYVDKVKNRKIETFYLRYITEINYHIGFCHDILGDKEKALVHFRNAVNLDPEDSLLNYSLGLAYLKQGDMGSAIAHFERSLALNGENLMAANSLALCYEKIGQYDKAEKLLRMVAEKDSGSVSARENLVNFLSKKNGL